MQERSVKVHVIVVVPACAPDAQHVRPAKIADDAPDGPAGERHAVCDVADRAIGVRGDEEQD
jgi:hypothetical protein